MLEQVEKKCTHCFLTKPVEQFKPIYTNTVNGRVQTGWRSWCKLCQQKDQAYRNAALRTPEGQEARRLRELALQAKRRVTHIQERVCTHCAKTLSIDHFKPLWKINGAGERYQVGWKSWCRRCVHATNKAREKARRTPKIALRLQQNAAAKQHRMRALHDAQNTRKLKIAEREIRYNQKHCCICGGIFARSEDHFLRIGRLLSRACRTCEPLKGLSSAGRFRVFVRRICAEEDYKLLQSAQQMFANAEVGTTEANGKHIAVSGRGYLNYLEKQRFRCPICKERLTSPHVDHDHKTGQVRGLLCARCNFAVGHFRDSIENLQNAIVYLM